jgi:hypothetical protein
MKFIIFDQELPRFLHFTAVSAFSARRCQRRVAQLAEAGHRKKPQNYTKNCEEKKYVITKLPAGNFKERDSLVGCVSGI